MKNHPWIVSLVIVLLAAGCGGSGKEKLYTKGPMHPMGNFDGVYQSDFGRLEITVAGDSAVGVYEKNDVYGRLEGEIDGNLFYFKWTQWNVEMRGKIRTTSGRGVFQYIVEEDEAAAGAKAHHWMKGFWNYDNEAPTNPWNAYKFGEKAQKKLKPFDPASYTGDEEEEVDYSEAGGFQDDGSGGGAAAPEESDGVSGDDAELF